MGMLGHSVVFFASSFQVGKQFDALLIDTTAPTPPVFDVFDQDTLHVSKIHQLDLSSLSKKKQQKKQQHSWLCITRNQQCQCW